MLALWCYSFDKRMIQYVFGFDPLTWLCFQ